MMSPFRSYEEDGTSIYYSHYVESLSTACPTVPMMFAPALFVDFLYLILRPCCAGSFVCRTKQHGNQTKLAEEGAIRPPCDKPLSADPLGRLPRGILFVSPFDALGAGLGLTKSREISATTFATITLRSGISVHLDDIICHA